MNRNSIRLLVFSFVIPFFFGNANASLKGKPAVFLQGNQIVHKNKIYFNTAKATLRKRSFATLDLVADVMRKHQRYLFVIEVHTDNRGSTRYNTKLSQHRAEAVRRFLISRGIAGIRLKAKGYGPTRPIFSNRTRVGRSKNRRTVFRARLPKMRPKPRTLLYRYVAIQPGKIRYIPRKAKIHPSSFANLQKVVKILKKHPAFRVRIGVHSDSRGSTRYNLRLTTARAKAVKAYLVSKGISKKRLVAIGYGKSRPIAPNRTRKGRMMNRRTEFRVIKRP